MTIKTLEELVGMTRANIRFYEQEGLISPARLENGYRDYSEADAEALRKIKLFRRLHLDLDAIRRLQAGELTLAQALEEQLAALEADQEALDRARQVCRELKESGTDYAALDPKPWLEKLERPPVPESPRYAPPADRGEPPASVLHPWRRFFARRVDFLLYGLIWTAAYALGLHWNQPSNLWTTLFNSYVIWGLAFLAEPLLLHFWGTTPGKALFGISIRKETGERLTLREAFRRTWRVFAVGCGYGIPFYELWRNWKAYKSCQDGERPRWEGESLRDDRLEWERYETADDAAWRCLACAGAYGLSVALSTLIGLQSLMPPNRGELTAAEFYENCNFYLDYLGVGGDDRLDENGGWVEPVYSGDGVVIDLMDEVETEFSVTLTDGVVTGVRVVRQGETQFGLWRDNTYQSIALLALAGSQPEINCLNFEAAQWADLPDTNGWEYDVSHQGLHVSQSMQKENFMEASLTSEYLIPLEGQTGRFTQTFTITLERE